eukprot:6176895-Pleurochrysis_carterae.AAC.1
MDDATSEAECDQYGEAGFNITVKMREGGGEFPETERRFSVSDTVATPAARSLTESSSSTPPLTTPPLAEQQTIGRLQTELRSVSAQLKQLQKSYKHEVEKGIRAGVRAARAASDDSVYGKLAALEDEVVQLRRSVQQNKQQTTRMETVRKLEGKVGERDEQLAGLRSKLEASEKREALLNRRVADLMRKEVTCSAELTALKKKRTTDTRESEAFAKRARGDAAAAAEKLSAAEAERARQDSKARKQEEEARKQEETLHGLNKTIKADLEAASKQALLLEARVVELKSKLDASRKEKLSAPKAHTEDEWEELSDVGRRSARSRNMEFVQSIMSLRAWRVADWATAVKRQGWLDELWETKELWELKMHWARELFGMLMGQHWGVSLGLYLTLTEHMPTRQIRRISQARYLQPLHIKLSVALRKQPAPTRAFLLHSQCCDLLCRYCCAGELQSVSTEHQLLCVESLALQSPQALRHVACAVHLSAPLQVSAGNPKPHSPTWS